MKLFTTMAVIGLCVSTALARQSLNKCKQIAKGGKRRYTTPRTIERGTNQPAGIDFLVNERSDLMKVFGIGKADDVSQVASDEMAMLAQFAAVTQDQYLGQIFRAAKQNFNRFVLDKQSYVKSKYGEEMGGIYRDNTQRIAKVFRDITYNWGIIYKMRMNKYVVDDINAAAMKYLDLESEVYKVFLDNHLEKFVPVFKDFVEEFAKNHGEIQKQVAKVLESEKQKANYRQLVNELPLIYQFVNDNIDFIEMQNVDKELGEAIASDLLHEMAVNQGDQQIANMIKRNVKFIKTIMTDRALQQQKNKVVEKVMEKNKELVAAVANEAEFDRLVKEYEATGQELTKEMQKTIWNQAKENVKNSQQEQISNQAENLDNTKHKPKQGLTRYEHIAGIMALMPDDLAASIAQMVKESCPELDLLQIDTAAMKAIVEEQPENFLDQLIKELHDVCDMFGLIDETKVIKKMINGIEVEIYAADWLQGEKKVW